MVHRVAHRPLKAFFKNFFQIAAVFRFAVPAAQGEDAFKILGHLGPVFIEGVFLAGRGRCDHVAPGQAEELAVDGQVTDFQLKSLGRFAYVDVPIIHAAVNFNVADYFSGGYDRPVAKHLEQSQYRTRGVPVLIHRHLARLMLRRFNSQ